jgi:GTP 3',8-cyclase
VEERLMADRGIDGHKLHLHPERVAEWKKNGDTFPIKMEVGVTDACNHRCSFCALDFATGGSTRLSKEVFIPAINEMAEQGVRAIYFAGEGEPLMHQDFPEFVRVSYEAGMKVSCSTNGALFTPEKAELILPYLSWMRFSVDAGTPKTHARIHGTRESDFGKIITNIGHASRIKRENSYDVDIAAQAVMVSENRAEMASLAKIIGESGADSLQIKPYSQHPLSENHNSSPYEAFGELEKELAQHSREGYDVIVRTGTVDRLTNEKDYRGCHGLSFSGLITAKGDVIPCNIFYGAPDFSYGNLNEKSFSEIWTGQQRKEVIGKLRESLPDGCRAACPLDAMNRYLQRLVTPGDRDAFI